MLAMACVCLGLTVATADSAKGPAAAEPHPVIPKTADATTRIIGGVDANPFEYQYLTAFTTATLAATVASAVAPL